MRKFGILLLTLAMAALFCVLIPGLVHGSEAEDVPESSRPSAMMLICTADVPSAQPMVPAQAGSGERDQTAAMAVHDESAPCLVLCDGNGWPLTGRTWVREAWAANPPESVPGS